MQTNPKTSSPSAMSQQEVFNLHRLSEDEIGHGDLVLLGIRNYTAEGEAGPGRSHVQVKVPGHTGEARGLRPLGMKCHCAGGTEDAEQVNMLPTLHS